MGVWRRGWRQRGVGDVGGSLHSLLRALREQLSVRTFGGSNVPSALWAVADMLADHQQPTSPLCRCQQAQPATPKLTPCRRSLLPSAIRTAHRTFTRPHVSLTTRLFFQPPPFRPSPPLPPQGAARRAVPLPRRRAAPRCADRRLRRHVRRGGHPRHGAVPAGQRLRQGVHAAIG